MKTTSLLFAASVFLFATVVAPAATEPATNAPVKMDERDYYIEELKIAEELLQREEKQAAVELLGGLPFDNRSGSMYGRPGVMPMSQPPPVSFPMR